MFIPSISARFSLHSFSSQHNRRGPEFTASISCRMLLLMASILPKNRPSIHVFIPLNLTCFSLYCFTPQNRHLVWDFVRGLIFFLMGLYFIFISSIQIKEQSPDASVHAIYFFVLFSPFPFTKIIERSEVVWEYTLKAFTNLLILSPFQKDTRKEVGVVWFYMLSGFLHYFSIYFPVC